MDYITNINSIIDKTIFDIVEDYYYKYAINISPIKLNQLFNIAPLTYIHKPIKDCTIAELCYSGDKYNLIYHIVNKYQIDINTKNNSLPLNISSKFIYDSYKNDINKFLLENPCNYYTFIYDNFINNPKIDMNNLKFYILHNKLSYLEDKLIYLNDKYKSIDNTLTTLNTNIMKISYILLSLFIYNSIIIFFFIK